MKSLADTIRLRRFCFRFCMVYVLLVEIKLIFMMFPIAAIFRSAICQNTQDWNLFAVKERNDTIIEHIGGKECIFPVIQLFGKCLFGIGVNHSLLVDSSNSFHVADTEGILSNQVPWMFCFNLSCGLLFFFCFFQGLELRLR